jgi:protein gp37
MTTKIEWTRNADGSAGSTWNPVRGCSRISPGCGGGGSYSGSDGERGGCYAEAIAARYSKPGQPFHGFAEMTPNGPRWTGKVALIPKKLSEPLRRRNPTTWFCSMFDLFHEDLTNDEIAAVFGVMAACPRHTFQILTKRAVRLPRFFDWIDEDAEANDVIACQAARVLYPNNMGAHLGFEHRCAEDWPLHNVWLGVSVEDQKRKTRIEHLRRTPATVRFLSLEPLLEDLGDLDLAGIDQCIVGAESGRGARPMNDDWVRRIRDQAKAQGCAFFFKQKLDARGHKVSLPMLDGRSWDEMPMHAAQGHV